MLLETIAESDNQLINSRVIDDFGSVKHQEDQDITVAKASNILYHGTCSRHNTDHNSSMSTFAAATETDLKRLKDKKKNTMQSTVTWINQFETWQKVLLRNC